MFQSSVPFQRVSDLSGETVLATDLDASRRKQQTFCRPGTGVVGSTMYRLDAGHETADHFGLVLVLLGFEQKVVGKWAFSC